MTSYEPLLVAGYSYSSPYELYKAAKQRFDPDSIPDEDLPACEELYDAWAEQYKCEYRKCSQERPALDEETRRLWVWRKPFMVLDDAGNRICPECLNRREDLEKFKARSPMLCKRDSMRTYNLSRKDMDILVIRGTFPNPEYPNGPVGKLYLKTDCERASLLKKEKKRKAEEKKVREAEEKERRKKDREKKRRENELSSSAARRRPRDLGGYFNSTRVAKPSTRPVKVKEEIKSEGVYLENVAKYHTKDLKVKTEIKYEDEDY